MDVRWRKLLNNLESINVDTALHYSLESVFFGNIHSHPKTFHISFILQGNCQVQIDNKKYEVKPGYAVFIKPQIKHCSFESDKRFYELMEIKFSSSTLRAIESVPVFPAIIKIQNQPAFISSLERIILSKKLENFSGHHLLLVRLIEMLMLLADESNQPQIVKGIESQIERNIHQIARYISTEYNQHLSVEKLAEMVGMSPNYFATKFTKFYKISPIEMLIQTRMHHARELLKHTRLSITEIAKLCGFNSSQYFAKIFSKREHLSPKEFRNKMNNG